MNKIYFKPFDWKSDKEAVDNSAWSRLNDIIYEARRIPIYKDKKEFLSLPYPQQQVLLHCFASLSVTSGLQMEKGIAAVQQVSATPKEAAVFNALQYLESINNRNYSYLIEELTNSIEERNKVFKWIDNDPYLQNKNYRLNAIYQSGNSLQRLAAMVLLNSGFYHSAFFAPLYLFGEGKLPKIAESIKYALRITSFSSMYPGIKFRKIYARLSPEKQKEIANWVNNFLDTLLTNEIEHIKLLYKDTGWTDKVITYLKYTLNKGILSLGLEMKYPETDDSVDADLMHGIIESADADGFFFYANRHAINHMKEIK